MATLRFLGSGDSQGVPRWWCGCEVCKEARSTGRNARTRPSILIEAEHETILIDAAPELRLQMIRENVKDIDAVLISHAHNDHILGLGDLADMARWTGRTVPIYAPAEVIPQLKERFAYLTQGAYPNLVPFYTFETNSRTFAGYRVHAHKVPHGFNGWSYAFRFEGDNGSWAYVSDSLMLEDLAPWQGLELLILGTSFYKENAPLEKRSVYDVTEALELLELLQPKRALLTHLGHGIDVRRAVPKGVAYAKDGLVIRLPRKNCKSP